MFGKHLAKILLRRNYSIVAPTTTTATNIPFPLVFSEEVKHALKNKHPIVALESTIITHGMPFPQNVECALEVERCVRETGSIPATIAILRGQLTIGLSENEITQIGDTSSSKFTKTSRRDFSYVIANKLNGGTTVSGTIIGAHMAGIGIIATGGIGGVHRLGEATMDISADLMELGRTPIAVVSSGVKSILDIPKTLEYLETQGVFVCTYGDSTEFPAFYTRRSGCTSPYSITNPIDAARIIQSTQQLNLKSGMLFAVPIPETAALDDDDIARSIQCALDDADAQQIRGKEITPFLLSKVSESTGGKSLESNMSLVQNNAHIAGEIAVALRNLEETEDVRQRRKEKIVVIGGSVLDRCVHLSEDEIKDNRLTGMRFLDFQIMHEGCPIIDLSYFMFTSGCLAKNFENIENYLITYYGSFGAHCKRLNVDAASIPTYMEVREMWCKYAAYGFLFGLFVNKMMVSERAELERHHNPLSVFIGFDFVSTHESLFLERIRDGFTYLYENEMLGL